LHRFRPKAFQTAFDDLFFSNKDILSEAIEMKIHSNDEILKNALPQKVNENQKPTDKVFGAVLKEAIENSSKVGAGDQKPPVIDAVPEIQFSTSLAGEKIPTLDRVERFLDLLDKYHQKLGNPQATLRDIHPLINELEMEKENLIPVLNSLPDGDGLKDILNQTLITSSLEIIRFNRGDYVDR